MRIARALDFSHYMNPPELSIVIPVLEEQHSVGPLYEEIRQAFANSVQYEIHFVDDGSTDDTVNRLKSLAERDQRVQVSSLGRHCGKSDALLLGIESSRAAWIVTMDGDGQNDPTDALRLFQKLLSAGDHSKPILIAGQRRRRADSVTKRLSSWIANRARRLLLRDGVNDSACGLKAFSRDSYLELPRFDGMHRFLPALYQLSGGQVEMLPVTDRPRSHGVSKYGIGNRLWVGISDVLRVMELKRTFRVDPASCTRTHVGTRARTPRIEQA